MLWVLGSAVAVCVAAARGDRTRLLLGALLGLGVAVLFVVDLPAWVRVLPALVVSYGTLAAAGGSGGSVMKATWGRVAALPLALALTPALPCVLAALVLGSSRSLGGTFAVALPSSPGPSFTRDALFAAVVVLACQGARSDEGRSTAALRAVWTAAVCVLAVLRLVWVAQAASIPLETRWSEAPALVNALKLDAGEPLYGPPERLDSYVYAPLLDLLHHAALAPVHLELSLLAHRALVVAEQLGAGGVLAWAIGPALARAGWGWPGIVALLSLLSLVNLLAAAVHPDHLVLLAFAVAAAALVAEERWARPFWWLALALAAPLAAAAKLTGAGIGVGLAASFALERRWRPAAVAALSLAAAAATIPLFDATLGACKFYVVDVPRSHPLEFAKLATLPSNPYFVVAAGAAGLFAWSWWGAGKAAAKSAAERGALRLFVLTGACAASSMPAWIKYGGRDNNLVLLAVGSVCAALAGLAHPGSRGRRSVHPWLAPVAALLGVTLVAPPALYEGTLRRASERDAALIERVLRDDAAAGRTTLSVLSVATWIAAGRRDVPRDRFQSVIELWSGRLPEAEVFFSHLDDGRYDTLLLPGAYLHPDATRLGQLDGRLRDTLLAHYALVGPPQALSASGYEWSLVFRKKATSTSR